MDSERELRPSPRRGKVVPLLHPVLLANEEKYM
jgi:hypothetical protein